MSQEKLVGHRVQVVLLSLLFSVFLQLASNTINQTLASPQYSKDKPLKIGFVMVGSVSDCGYNQQHDLGRKFLEANVANIKTTVVEKIPENAEAERVMEKLIAQGNRLIYSTSYGYLEPAERVAKRHPDVTIMQTWRSSGLKNMGCYAAYQYQPLYVVGMVAGKMTKKNNIGFVCAHPIPLLLQNINAFTLGARSVNPKAKVHVVWTNTWSDPAVEVEALKGLVDSGCDIVGSVGDSSLAMTKAAEQCHTMVFASQSNLQDLAPTCWLTGSHWDWGHIYCQITKSVLAGTWKPESYWLGMKEGAVDISPFGKLVPEAVRQAALAEAAKIRKGERVIFRGPLKDSQGKERLAAGKIPDQKWLSEMDFFVEGVSGVLPKHR